MLIYGLLLTFVLVASGVATTGNPGRAPRAWPTAAAALALTLVAGLRWKTGTDTGYYVLWFTDILPFERISDGRDPGFTALGKVVRWVAGDNPTGLLLTASALTCIPVVVTLRRYARPFPLGMALYIGTGVYFFAFNGVRQALAAAIIFGGSRHLFERRWRVFIPIVMFAALFHATALVFVPIYLLVTARAVTAANVAAGAALAVFVAFYESVVTQVSSAIGSGRFGDYAGEILEADRGAHWMRLLVRVVIFAVAFLRRREIARQFPDGGAILVNLSLLGVFFYVLAAVHWIYARMAVYPGMYEMLLLPAITRSFTGTNRGFVVASIFAAFLAYITLIVLAGDSSLLPYQSIFG